MNELDRFKFYDQPLTYEEAEENFRRNQRPVRPQPDADMLHALNVQSAQMASALQLMAASHQSVRDLVEKTLNDLEFYRAKVSLLEKRCNELVLENERAREIS